MNKVDFTPMHDIYIRNFDGSYQPMDEPFFEAEKVAENTWKILSDGDYSYLIAGTKRAYVVDSGYGAGNLYEFCQGMVDVPVEGIINSHSHFDHTANNCYFPVAYMHPNAVDQATIPYPSFSKIIFPRDYPVITVDNGYIFDLGDRTLEVFAIPDHTDDGIALLDRKERLLFSGDEFMKSKTLRRSVSHWKECLDKLMPHREEFDQLCAGEGVLEGSIVDKQYHLVCDILSGKPGEPAMPPGGPGGPGGPRKPGEKEDFNPMNPETYEGHKVYYRKFPHQEDVHRSAPDGKMRFMEYEGYRMMYDEEKLFESES